MLKGARLLLLIVILFNVAYNVSLPLHPDEAYYWVWSNHLALSYYDHPPLVAYVIRLITILGEDEVIIRLPAVLAMSGAAWLIRRTGCMLFNQTAGDAAMIIFLLVPMTHVGYLAVTPDPLLCFFWSLTLYLTCVALFRQKPTYLVLAGISAGCTLLAKYTGILLVVALLLYMVSVPRFRSLLISWRMLAAVCAAILVFSPVIIWNWHNDWVSFRYQFGHGVATEKVLNAAAFFEFAFGQAAVSNPFFYLPLWLYLLKAPRKTLREPRLAVLAWPFLVTLLFFGYNALFKKSELNWAMPAMISGSVLLGYWLRDNAKRRFFCLAGVYLLAAVIIFKVPEVVPGLPGEIVMKNKFSGNDKLFSDLRWQGKGFVLSDHYEDAAILSYYLPGQPDVYILDKSPVSQYSFWRNKLTANVGEDAVWIGKGEPSTDVKAAFERVDFDKTLVYADRFVVKRYNVFSCKKYNGLLP